jgi:hypothetical protein
MATVCLPHRVKFETRASENKTVAYTRRAGRPMCSGSYRTNWTTLSACARASGGHGNDHLRKELDHWRSLRPKPPSRSRAIRVLLRRALAAEKEREEGSKSDH